MHESCVRDFFVLFSGFIKQKVIINKNVSFTDHTSQIWLPDSSKLFINGKNDNNVTTCQHDVIVKFFDIAVFFLSHLVTGPSFMSISFTGSGVMTIFVCKGLTRNPEI